MTLRVVQDLSADDQVIVIESRSYPAPSVVEGSDGVRALLLSSATDGSIPSHLWAAAHSLGVGYLLFVGEPCRATTAERFMDCRIEQSRRACYDFTFDDWSQFPALPSYRDLILSEGPVQTPVAEQVNGFVHLHSHSHYSALDGLSTIDEMVAVVVADGQQALAATDHGNCAAHPELAEKCTKAGIKPVFGMEANLVLDRHRRGRSWMAMVDQDGVEYEVDPASVDKEVAKALVRRSDANDVLYGYQHITLWAMNDKGLRNLWAMSTEGNKTGFYGRPRIDYDTLERLNEGILASTGCLRGPLAQAVLDDDLGLAHQNVSRLMHLFPDRLYVEIHTNQLDEQVKANHAAVQIAQSLGLPMIAAVDSHYPTVDDKETHRAWLAMQTNKDLSDDSSLFAGGHDYHLFTTAEVTKALAYLDPGVVEQCIANTASLTNRCTAVLAGATDPPTFSKPSAEHPDPVQRDVERLIDLCLKNWDLKVSGKGNLAVYEDRFVREMNLLIAKQFCGYFLVVADYVNWAKGQGCLVGPGRGSGGGSLVAYLAGIHGCDPIEGDLIFERFLTEGRTELPDFDVDFPASWRERLKGYLVQRWGEDYVLTIGTVTRLQSKGAFNDAVRVLKPTLGYEVAYTDANLLKKAITAADAHLAGKHMPWDEFCVEFADIVDPLRAKYPEPMALMEKILYRIKSYGKHPAGVVVSTGAPLTDLPMRMDDDGNMISQFDMSALEKLGYVKFDLLTLRTLDTIQATIDLIHARFSRRIDVYSWREEYDDPQVWDEVSAGHTLGIFQIETRAGTKLTRQHRPSSILELADVMTLVRPGPTRSGLTETYLKRRAGLESVSFPDQRMAEVLEPTYGAIIYQEQVLACFMLLAKYDSTKADTVRKILGKKQVEKVEAAGREFVEAAAANGMTLADSEHLWAQLAEFAKYGFGKAHAYGYSILGFWAAWLKFHFPVQFLAASLSTVDADRLPEFVGEARRMGYIVGGPDVNDSSVLFSSSNMTMRYGLSSVKGVGMPTAKYIVDHQPYLSMEDFASKCLVKGSPFDRGHLSSLVSVGAFDSLISNRRAVEMTLDAEATGAAKTCVSKDIQTLGPGGLPCTFDWANEVNPPLEAKGRGKDKTFVPKGPPRKCTVACRNYTRPAPIDPDTVEPYTADDIRDREKELLGVWLSSSPFDRLDPEDLAVVHTTEEVESGPINAEYLVAALVEAVREKVDRNGNRYAFISLNAQNGPVDAICFASTYEKIRTHLRADVLVFAVLWKTDKGVNLTALRPAL